MEYVIAIFCGVWVSAAGLFAYWRIKKDFSQINTKKGETVK